MAEHLHERTVTPPRRQRIREKGDVLCATCRDKKFRCRYCLRDAYTCHCANGPRFEPCPDCNGGVLRLHEPA